MASGQLVADTCSATYFVDKQNVVKISSVISVMKLV
jgi:hypothetical protein